MKELSHAELCSEHYQALKNPMYRMEFMMDVMREELSMELPWHNPDFGDARATQIVYRIRPVDKEIAQLKAKMMHLENKWNEHMDYAKKNNEATYK